MVQSTIKKDIYKDYHRDMKTRWKGEAIATELEFLSLWRVLFPHCQIRKYCQIMGKCVTCADIDYLKQNADDPEVRKRAADLHAMHRGGNFMRERATYQRRKRYAMEHRDTVLSIIIDKMDQDHCKVPSKGTQYELSHPLKVGMHNFLTCLHCDRWQIRLILTFLVGLTGVKEHGVSVTFYRTIDSVNKGANLTIHCISKQLEEWIRRHNGKCPEEIFVQVQLIYLYIYLNY